MLFYKRKPLDMFVLSYYLLIILVVIQGVHMYILVPGVTSVEKYSPNQEGLSLADRSTYHYTDPEGPGTYAFGYDINDPVSGNTQFRDEERHPDGSVTGSYGYVDPFGVINIVHYIADTAGYRATIERKPPNTVWLKATPKRYPVYG